MKRTFFPGCGFGFWFLLPHLFLVADDHHIGGASGGSLMCLIALLPKEHRTYNFIMKQALEVFNESSFPLNIYDLLHSFVHKLSKYLEGDNVNRNIKRMSVQLTQITLYPPSLERVFVFPQTMEELLEYILISTYIPVLARNEQGDFFYNRDGNLYLDGAFYDMVYGAGEDSIANDYSSIPWYIPSEVACREMFIAGERVNSTSST